MTGQRLTDEEFEELEAILNACNEAPPNRLNDWERGFIEDNLKRFDQYGKNILLSEKQWAVLRKIYAAITD